MFSSKLLTADPKEHLNRSRIILDQQNDALLLYSALELRLAIERIIHNQYTLSEDHKFKHKKGNDPKKKKLLMNSIDPKSDKDNNVYYIDPKTEEKIFWGVYKNIPTDKIKSIEGRLGNLLHMKLHLKLGLKNDPFYHDTREFLNETTAYLAERLDNSVSYFSIIEIDNFILAEKSA